MGLARQVGRFGVVGVAATLLDYAVLMALSQLAGVPVLYASAASYVVSLVFNYAASMRYVFTHREGMSRGREFALFVVLSVIGLCTARSGRVRFCGDCVEGGCDRRRDGVELRESQEVAGRPRAVERGRGGLDKGGRREKRLHKDAPRMPCGVRGA